MKLDKAKYKLALARACLTPAELCEKADLPRPSLNNATKGRGIRPATLGKIARALGVDVTEIMEQEQ